MSSFDSQNQASKKLEISRKRGAIWENFTEVEVMGEARMRCKECHKDITKHHTSLKSHWEWMHKDKQQPAKKIRAEESVEFAEPGLPNDKYKKIHTALAAVLSIPALSINSLLHPLVRKFLKLLNPNFEIPRSYASLKKILVKQFGRVQSVIKEQLSHLPQRFSITCDVWTDSGLKNAYLGVTLHFVDANAILQRVFLGLRQLEGSHTSYLIKRETEKLLQEYGMSLSDAFKVVTDGGSNMVKGFNDVRLLKRIPEDDQEEEEEDEEEEFEEEEFEDPENNFEDQYDEGELLIATAFLLRVNCFAHALQLVIMQVFKECVGLLDCYKTMLNLISRFKKSHQATKELTDAGGKNLLLPSKTRWASQIAVIGRYLELKREVAKVAQLKSWEHPTESENKELEEVYKLTKIFADVLLRVQAENNVTISKCYGFIKAMNISLDNYEAITPSDTAKKLRVLLIKRFDKYVNRDSLFFDPIFFVAASLDPSTANLLSPAETEIAVAEIQNLVPFEEPQQPAEVLPTNMLNKTLDQILEKMAADNVKSRNKGDSPQADKSWVQQALSRVKAASFRGMDPLKYWASLMNTESRLIAVLAMEVLSVPATSAPIERIFSQAGLATSKHRNRTEHELLNAQIVVYCYYHAEDLN